MGNSSSTTSPPRSRRSRSSPETATDRAKKVVGDIHEGLKKSVKKLDDDHPAAQLIDSVCGGYFDDEKYRHSRSASFYSEEVSEDGSRTVSEDGTYDDRSRSKKDATSVESSSCMSQSDYESEPKNRRRKATSNSFDTEDDSRHVTGEAPLLSKPLASSFAKRCYFTKSGIGKTTQHYEGLTLTGNIVLMLAAAMKLKGCPTICDEDLRRVEQTYPNQFSRLPDELLLSSGWRRISKYCHFSNKPIPDGIPFFHSKQRLHPSGGYYFLLAAAVGMVRPIDVEPLTRDTLVLLETDFPTQCDATPDVLINDPDQWTLVDKFCFFSGGPINTEEDVYYQADFDGNPIYMLAFLSPSLTPEELYKLGDTGEPGLKSSAAVQEVESVYDLTERDFDDLKLYHLGPCRALPQYILQPEAWTKVLPPHFLAARQTAMMRAKDYESRHRTVLSNSDVSHGGMQSPNGDDPTEYYEGEWAEPQNSSSVRGDRRIDPDGHDEILSDRPHDQDLSPDEYFENESSSSRRMTDIQREVEEEGAFIDETAPMDEAIASRYPLSPSGKGASIAVESPKMDPPEDEPPSLTKRDSEDGSGYQENDGSYPPQETSAKRDSQEEVFSEEEPGEYDDGPDEDEPGPEYYEEQYYEKNGADQDYYAQDNEGQYRPKAKYQDPDGEFAGSSDPYIDAQYPSQQHGYDNNSFHHSKQGPFPNSDNSGYTLPPVEGAYNHEPNDDPRYAEHAVQDYVYGQQLADDYPDAQESDDKYHSVSYSSDHYRYAQHPTDDMQYQHQPSEGSRRSRDRRDYYESPKAEFPIASTMGDFPTSPEDGEFSTEGHFFGADEKKVASDESDAKPPRERTREPVSTEPEEEFTPIKREGYTLGRALSPSPRSLVSKSSEGGNSAMSSTSALRAAQDQLRRNRRRRMEMAMKSRNRQDSPREYAGDDNQGASQRDDESAATWESTGSELTASVISGSSAWTDGSNPTDRSSRRALILQMAKARMKSSKDTPSDSTPRNGTIQEELADRSQAQDDIHGDLHSNFELGQDIDLTADLD